MFFVSVEEKKHKYTPALTPVSTSYLITKTVWSVRQWFYLGKFLSWKVHATFQKMYLTPEKLKYKCYLADLHLKRIMINKMFLKSTQCTQYMILPTVFPMFMDL